LQGLEKTRLVGNDVVGGKNAEDGIRILALNEEGGKTARRSGVARHRLLNDVRVRHAGQLVGNFVRQKLVGDDPGFSIVPMGLRRSTVC
jgi:hypothetical protein